MVIILRKSSKNHEAQPPNSSVFIGQKSKFARYCIQNGQDNIQIQVYTINNESVNHFCQLMSVIVRKSLRKSQAQFREKPIKWRLRQNDEFLVEINMYSVQKIQ